MTLSKTIPHLALLLGILLTFYLSLIVLVKAEYSQPKPSSLDLWNTLSEFTSTTDLRMFLNENCWVSHDISTDELDYIIVLTEQCSTFYGDRVKPEILLAMIAVESGFDPDCKTGSALGLMQIIPKWHYGRLSYFTEADTEITSDLFYDPRLNIMCGADYMSDLLEYTCGDIYFALMCYNQGQTSARIDYVMNGHISAYAETVVELADEIKQLIYN